MPVTPLEKCLTQPRAKYMKRIVLCFDGTWDKPPAGSSQVASNVWRFHTALAPAGPDGVTQLGWYNEGVGTSWWNHLAA
jgi:uncharacterized protein (DUF2235 family)